MPGHPDPRRLIAVVSGDGHVHGSGYALSEDLVLTAAHVVDDLLPDRLLVSTTGADPAPVPAVLAWSGADVALLRTPEPVPRLPEALSAPEWAELAPGRRYEDCGAIGLPVVLSRLHGIPDPLHADFRIAPATGHRSGRLTLEFQGTPPTDRPWQGMSGAPVFYRGRWLVGVIVADDGAGWQHARLEAVPTSAFVSAPPLNSPFCLADPATSEAEQQYLDAVDRSYRTVQLFGLGTDNSFDHRIRLDDVYVGLDAEPLSDTFILNGEGRGDGRPPGWPSGPEPVESVIANHPRLLLRGDAGAGKSTVLERLAVGAARRDLTGALAPLNGRLPLLLRMRDMYSSRWSARGEPPRLDELVEFTGLVKNSGFVPDLSRALLLVDGIDEIFDEDRDRARDWLTALVDDHPDAQVVATGRPRALQEWRIPRALGFREYRLLDLDLARREAIVANWHRAATRSIRQSHLPEAEKEEQAEELERLHTDLTEKIERSADLADLASTPLLCAVLCKLHERYGSQLPRFRHELYERTIDMMLGLRDADRNAADPLRGLDVPDRRQLLARVADYMATEGNEIDVPRFDMVIAEGLLSLAPSRSFTAQRIREGLVRRSGLLLEPREGALKFSHRTFQDYLLAVHRVGRLMFGDLAAKTGNSRWDDLLQFAMSRCEAANAQTFAGELRRAAEAEADPLRRARIQLAAGACDPYARELPPSEREFLVSGVAEVICGPHRRNFTVREYAATGHRLVDHLRSRLDELPERGEDDYSALEDVLDIAAEIGGPHSLALLAEATARCGPEHWQQLNSHWHRFPAAEYAHRVLLPLVPGPDELVLHGTEEAACAHLLGRFRSLVSTGAVDQEVLRHAILATAPAELEVLLNPLATDLGLLAGAGTVTGLRLSRCAGLTSLDGLPGSTVTELDISLPIGPPLPAVHQVEQLTLRVRDPIEALPRLDSWRSLRSVSLHLQADQPAPSGWEDIDKLTVLVAHAGTITAAGHPLPSVRHLRISLGPSDPDLHRVAEILPELETLQLASLSTQGRGEAEASVTADLTPLSRLARLRTVEFFPTEKLHLLGTEHFAEVSEGVWQPA